MYDAFIIGAGMSGLCAGIRCAHFGMKVAILERHTTIGGLNSFYRLRGRNHDVGLHAVTNFTPKGTKKGPLARLLRQLRFNWEDFELAPQRGSAIAFPDVKLTFSNEPGSFRASVAEKFPTEIAGFDRLVAKLMDYDDTNPELYASSAREIVSSEIRDPLLIEMIFCPVMYYGSAREDDMNWGQFSIMFRSVLLEGLARPYDGVRVVLKQLTRRYKELGGELKLRAGVQKIELRDNKVQSVVLDSGEEIPCKMLLSSAGWHETLRICHERDSATETEKDVDDNSSAEFPPGILSFNETISVLDCQPRELGHNETIIFFNDSSKFEYRMPRDRLTDLRSGVICSPNNYDYGDQPDLEGTVRLTALANFDRWAALNPEEYAAAKREWYDRMTESAVRFVPDFRPHVIDTDMFSPTTVRRFTWHDNGAIYGMPIKKSDGVTPHENLFVCGTDQGLVGIIGAMTSGVLMANQHLLRATT